MATKKLKSIPQPYPRIEDHHSKFRGCLDDAALAPHTKKLEEDKVRDIIEAAIKDANSKSRREILTLPADASDEVKARIYDTEGHKLFRYFKAYSGDPASTAYQTNGKHYRDVGTEAFRNQLLQRGRMNSGWRYQFLVVGFAREIGRFASLSDIGAAEGDFNARIAFQDPKKYPQPLSLYVSVKNRSNTMGGADWPKAIAALEAVAITDKNRTGPYCCVFGIAMDRGQRYIKRNKNGHAQSVNTEIWQSDFFWPFFTNLSYEEIMNLVLDVLMSVEVSLEELPTQIDVPDQLLDAFGRDCIEEGLTDELGNFNDPHKLVNFFCNPLPQKKKAKKEAKKKGAPPITHVLLRNGQVRRVRIVPANEVKNEPSEKTDADKE